MCASAPLLQSETLAEEMTWLMDSVCFCFRPLDLCLSHMRCPSGWPERRLTPDVLATGPGAEMTPHLGKFHLPIIAEESTFSFPPLPLFLFPDESDWGSTLCHVHRPLIVAQLKVCMWDGFSQPLPTSIPIVTVAPKSLKSSSISFSLLMNHLAARLFFFCLHMSETSARTNTLWHAERAENTLEVKYASPSERFYCRLWILTCGRFCFLILGQLQRFTIDYYKLTVMTLVWTINTLRSKFVFCRSAF